MFKIILNANTVVQNVFQIKNEIMTNLKVSDQCGMACDDKKRLSEIMCHQM